MKFKFFFLLFFIVFAIACQKKESNDTKIKEDRTNIAIDKQNENEKQEQTQNSLKDTVKDSDFTIKFVEAMDYKDLPGTNPSELNIIVYNVKFKVFPSEKNLIDFLNKRKNDNKYKGKIFPNVAYNIYFKKTFKYKIQYKKGKLQLLSDDKGNIKYF